MVSSAKLQICLCTSKVNTSVIKNNNNNKHTEVLRKELFIV